MDCRNFKNRTILIIMNTTSITGRVGKDAEIRPFNEKSAINFSVATTEKWRDKQGQVQEQTTWFNCTIWAAADRAQNVAQYIRKGDMISLRGKVSTRPYVGASGEPQASLELRVDEFTFCGSPKNQQPAAQPAAQPAYAQPVQAKPAQSYAQPVAQPVAQPASNYAQPVAQPTENPWHQPPQFITGSDGDLPF